jgi:hypothetical protein
MFLACSPRPGRTPPKTSCPRSPPHAGHRGRARHLHPRPLRRADGPADPRGRDVVRLDGASHTAPLEQPERVQDAVLRSFSRGSIPMRVTDPRTRTSSPPSRSSTAQGVPFGFAAEYLPVVLREMGYSRTQIAALFWLQLPWQLKPLWAPRRPTTPGCARTPATSCSALQCALALAMAAYALFPVPASLPVWFALTALAALLAATQDIFVDAFAVRSLDSLGRGYGNTAQVAGYRVGIILGGGGAAALPTAAGAPRPRCSLRGAHPPRGRGAFALRDDAALAGAGPVRRIAAPSGVARCWWARPAARGGGPRRVARRGAGGDLQARGARGLGAHQADAGRPRVDARGHQGRRWCSTAPGRRCFGAALGGLLHQGEGGRRAGVAAVAQAVSMIPLAMAARRGAAGASRRRPSSPSTSRAGSARRCSSRR